jgi:hypothetical protein
VSERFGVPDHSPQHAPDHALQNPTAQGSWGQPAADSSWSPVPAQSYGGGGGGGGYAGGGGPLLDPRRSIRTAVILAMLLGPLGLFYVGFLHGAVALFVVIPTARQLGLGVVAALGGRIEPVYAVLLMMWGITVPWALIGVHWRRRKLDQKS